MSLERPTEGKRKHKEDNFDSFSHQYLDNLICSDKENVKAFDNIEDLVDNILAKSKVTSYERHVKDIKRIQPFDKKRSAKRPKSCGIVGSIFGMSDLVSVKKLFSIVLSFVLLFAVLASASSFVDPDLDGATVNPEDMFVEDTLSSNATIPDTNHTDDTGDDEPHLDNSTLSSDQNGTVTADNENMINETGDTIDDGILVPENGSLNESIPYLDDIANETGGTIDNDTLMGENESLNVTNPLDNQTSNVLDNTTGYDNVSINVTTNESIDVSTTDENQSAYATHLNITLNTDKNSYLVNETVFISGTLVFNNSFVETTVNLSINSSDSSFLYIINTTNGTFSYEYIASKSGNYIVGAHVIFENETASTNTSFIVSDITDETDDVTVLSLIQGEAVVGESVFWEKKIMVRNNASIQRTLNIATTIPDTASNIKIQDVSEGNEVSYTVLVNQIVENNVSEQISSSTSIMFNGTFDAWGEREFTITYETPAPIKQEISYDGGKRIEIQSNATVHYSNVTAYTELPELSYKPRFYRVINGTRVDVTFDPIYNVTYLDNNSNGKYDGISWNVPRLSNDTYEIVIVITKAAHLDENRELISDIYDEVCKKDDIWSEPIYHNEYVRVTFEQNLTNRNDITFYARNNQSLNTIVEVYYYDSDEKITEFSIITQERYYKVFLTGMTGAHDVFDLRIKNLDNKNSAYLEFDYILDPSLPFIESWEVVLEPDAGADGITIPKPSGTVENDLLVAIIVLDASDIIGYPEGWVVIAIQTATGMGATALYKVANASEGSDYTFTWTNEQSVSGMLRISGANVSGEVINVNDTGSASSGDPICPDIVTTVDNCLILRFIGIDDDDNGDNFDNYPADHVGLWARASSASSSSCSGGTAYENLTSKGSAGTATWDLASEAEGWASFSIAIAPLAETVNSAPTQTGESPTNQSTGISITPDLYVVCSDSDAGNTLNATWWSNSTDGVTWVQFGSNETSFASGTNITQTNSNFSSYSTTYWWSVNLSDGNGGWNNETYYFTTEAQPPSIPTVITNASTGVEEQNATLRGYLSNNGSADTTCGFRYGTSTGSYSENFSLGVKANQTEFSNDNGSLTQGQIYFYQAWANNSAGFNGTANEKTFLTKPEAPSGLNAQANSSSIIYLTWSTGTGYNTTYIERNASGITVWAREAGTEIYNGTGTYYEDTGLAEGVTYYYQAWTYANWTYDSTTLYQWSDNNDSAGPVTTPTIPTVLTNESTGVEEQNATLRGYLSNNGTADTTCGFRFGTTPGSYSENFSKGVIANQTEFDNDNSSLTQGQIYHYQAWANNSAGFTNGTERSFLTKPSSPSSLNAQANSTTMIYLSWPSLGTGANTTYIERNTISSWARGAGAEVYNGTDLNHEDSDGISAGNTYYYQAWGFTNWANATTILNQWSDAYTSAGPVTAVITPTVLTNESTGVEENNATVRGYLQSNGSADTTCGFRFGTSTGSYSENFSLGVTANQTEFDNDNDSLTSGDLYYYQAWANNSAGFASGSELKFFTKPPAVTNLAESISTNTTLNYTWTKATVGDGATAYTMIVLNETGYGNYPNSRTNGTEVYNGTAASNTTSSLTPGTHYYFSAFSWGIEDSTGNWNDTYDTMDAWTNPGDTTSVSTTNGTTWINVTFTHGQNGEYTMVRRNASGSAAFPADRTLGVEVDNTTNTYANDTGLLDEGVTYYYALWTWDTDGGKWCDYQTNITGITWNLSINATPSQWNLGNVWVGGSNTSADYYFNITNEGNATLNIQIKASNATNTTTGARWNLTATPDHNDFTLHYDKSGDGGWTIINTTYDVFVTSLGVDSEQTFDLKMTHATTSSVVDPMSLTVTFKSVVS